MDNSNNNNNSLNWGAAGGMAGAGLGEMFGGYTNPADSANGWMNQIPDQLKQYLMPYINNGNMAGSNLNTQINQNLNNPGASINQIGSNYHQSPGFQFALSQALGGAQRAASAGGMAGSPMHEQENMGIATGMVNQDYNNYLQNALHMYDTGMNSANNLYDIGARTGMGMGEDMASVLAQRAKLAYEGQNAENQHQGGEWGSLLGGLGSMAGMYFGGPFGAAAGGAIGNSAGNS